MSAANVKSNEEPSWREKFKQASPSCLTLFAIYTAIVVCFGNKELIKKENIILSARGKGLPIFPI